MNWKTRVIAAAFGAAAMSLLAQDTTSTTTQQTRTTRQETTSNSGSISGSVVQYTPGQTIVIQSSDGKTTTYSIGSAVQVPSDVQVGRKVTITTEPASDGSGPAVVSRIQTVSVDSNGQTKTTTEKTETNPSGTTRTVTTVSGNVTAYQPGQSITVEQQGRQPVTLSIDPSSQLPQDIAVGKTVTITTRTVSGSAQPVVRTVTYKTTTKTTKSTSTNPQ